MTTGMRKWMEKGCPDIPTTPAEVSIGREELRQLRDELAQYKNERDELRAKITEMEKQEPVMWANSSNINSSRINKERGGLGDQHTCSEKQTTYHNTPLYALPGAKGEEK